MQEDRVEGGSKRIISIGEIGFGQLISESRRAELICSDYDRLHFSPKETQRRHLPAFLGLAKEFKLPMFLHSRTSEAHVDLMKALKDAGWGQKGEGWAGGVVHSFTGTKEEVDELVSSTFVRHWKLMLLG